MTDNNIATSLNKVLADTFVLYFKTHSFHWNVEGPQFKALHDMFEEQYTELWQSTDEIAERLRAIGEYGPANYKSMMGYASLSEGNDDIPNATEMAQQLANDNAAIAESMKPSLKIAQEADDEVTADLIIGRMTVHEKAAWMLRSMTK